MILCHQSKDLALFHLLLHHTYSPFPTPHSPNTVILCFCLDWYSVFTHELEPHLLPCRLRAWRRLSLLIHKHVWKNKNTYCTCLCELVVAHYAAKFGWDNMSEMTLFYPHILLIIWQDMIVSVGSEFQNLKALLHCLLSIFEKSKAIMISDPLCLIVFSEILIFSHCSESL